MDECAGMFLEMGNWRGLRCRIDWRIDRSEGVEDGDWKREVERDLMVDI